MSRTSGTRRDARRLRQSGFTRISASDQLSQIRPNDNPKQPIESVQLGSRLFAFVNGKLLAKSGRLHC